MATTEGLTCLTSSGRFSWEKMDGAANKTTAKRSERGKVRLYIVVNYHWTKNRTLQFSLLIWRKRAPGRSGRVASNNSGRTILTQGKAKAETLLLQIQKREAFKVRNRKMSLNRSSQR